MAILTTAHAQLTRGRQKILISGPENRRLARSPYFFYRGEIYASGMAFGAVCPSLHTNKLAYLHIQNNKNDYILIMLPIINQRILHRLIIDILINRPRPSFNLCRGDLRLPR